MGSPRTYAMLLPHVSKEGRQFFKRQVVQYSSKRGIKPAARHYGVSRNTVRSWLRRFQRLSWEGLNDGRKGPVRKPLKTSQKIEKKIIEARKRTPCYGARRLKYFYGFKSSLGAIQRILRQNGLTRKRRKKYQKKNDLRAKKAELKSLTHLQTDVKYLTDIPNYLGALKKFKLPRFQYTVRDTKSGALFLGFSEELSELNARTMIQYVLSSLKPWMALEDVVVQTDNGIEFSGTSRKWENSHFTKAVHSYGAEHRYIPPGHSNANADVESIHNTIEEEFYDLTSFSSKADFFNKVESYRLFYNLVRPNYSKKGQTPWLIAQQDRPETDIASFSSTLSTIDLDNIAQITYNIGGQSIPVFPG